MDDAGEGDAGGGGAGGVSGVAKPIRITVAYEPPVGLTESFAKAAQRIAAWYRDFTVRALSMGLTLDQAKAILDSGALLASTGERRGSAEERLEHYACHGYLTVLLGEVLTQEEMVLQPFSYGAVLNGDMDGTYAKHFAEMSRDRQRGLTKAGIELALQTEWPLERAMAAVMPYLEEA